jgi:hypothetical protein
VRFGRKPASRSDRLSKLVVQVYVVLIKIARGHALFHPQQQLLGDLEKRRRGADQACV